MDNETEKYVIDCERCGKKIRAKLKYTLDLLRPPKKGGLQEKVDFWAVKCTNCGFEGHHEGLPYTVVRKTI